MYIIFTIFLMYLLDSNSIQADNMVLYHNSIYKYSEE